MPKRKSFEQWFCAELSRWWSKQAGDRLFAPIKGGRIRPVDADGARLLQYTSIVLKPGHSEASIHDMMDGDRRKEPLYARWFADVKRIADTAGSEAWWMVTQRRAKTPLLWLELVPAQTLRMFELPWYNRITVHYGDSHVVGLPLEHLWRVDAEMLREHLQPTGE